MSAADPPPLSGRYARLALLSGPLLYALAWLAERVPSAVELVFASGLGPALSWPLSRLTGLIPFSVAELLLVAFVLRQLHRLVVHPWRTERGRRRRAVGRATIGVAAELSLAMAVFYLLWGLHYSRSPLPERWQWPPSAPSGYEDLVAVLAEEMVSEANRAYLALHGSEDAGFPTPVVAERWEALEVALQKSFAALHGQGAMPASAAWNWGRPKRPWISPLMRRLGLSGFYFPWTGEANVNRSLPAVAAAHALAHECAHQRGVASEDEANFVGFLAGWSSGDRWGRYGAALFAQRQLMWALGRSDPERLRALVQRRLPGVQRDVDDLRAYWERARGPLRSVARNVNHAYLRGNRVEGGVASYGRSLTLLLRWAQLRGGRAALGPDDQTPLRAWVADAAVACSLHGPPRSPGSVPAHAVPPSDRVGAADRARSAFSP